MLNKELSAEIDAQSSTKADNSKSASVEANPVLSAALLVGEGNKLIGEFVNNPFIKKWKRYNYKGEFPYKDLKYHSSWDCLMPVCQKISTLKNYPMPILNGIPSAVPYVNAMTKMVKGVVKFDLNETYLGVIEFIKWYNDNAVSVGSI